MDGEVHRKDDMSQFSQNYPEVPEKESKIEKIPKNYHEMIRKLEQRYKQKEDNFIAKTKAEKEESSKSTGDLQEDQKELAKRKLVTRRLRLANETKTLSDATVIREPKSGDIQDLRKKLHDEINEVGQRIIKDIPKEQLSSLEEKLPEIKKLRGRVSRSSSPSD